MFKIFPSIRDPLKAITSMTPFWILWLWVSPVRVRNYSLPCVRVDLAQAPSLANLRGPQGLMKAWHREGIQEILTDQTKE